MSNKNSKNNSQPYVSHTKINIQANIDTDENAVALSGLSYFRSNRVKVAPGVYKFVESKWLSEASSFILSIVTETQAEEFISRDKVALSTKPQYNFNAFFCACDQLLKLQK